MPAVMLANFERIFLGREAVELIAVRQFARKRREFVLRTKTAIGLEPGKDFAYRLDGQIGNQLCHPRSRAYQKARSRKLAFRRIDGHAIIMMMYSGHRAVKQLRAARLFSKRNPGFDGGFAMQHA
ncbi:hypothetical protein D3C85_1396680 [compost metagenome]